MNCGVDLERSLSHLVVRIARAQFLVLRQLSLAVKIIVLDVGLDVCLKYLILKSEAIVVVFSLRDP